jgi:hypothetical protein
MSNMKTKVFYDTQIQNDDFQGYTRRADTRVRLKNRLNKTGGVLDAAFRPNIEGHFKGQESPWANHKTSRGHDPDTTMSVHSAIADNKHLHDHSKPHKKKDCTKGAAGKIWRKNKKEFDQWEQGNYGPIDFSDSVLAVRKDGSGIEGVKYPARVTNIQGNFITVRYEKDGNSATLPFTGEFVTHNVSPDVPISPGERRDEAAFDRLSN